MAWAYLGNQNHKACLVLLHWGQVSNQILQCGHQVRFNGPLDGGNAKHKSNSSRGLGRNAKDRIQ